MHDMDDMQTSTKINRTSAKYAKPQQGVRHVHLHSSGHVVHKKEAWQVKLFSDAQKSWSLQVVQSLDVLCRRLVLLRLNHTETLYVRHVVAAWISEKRSAMAKP